MIERKTYFDILNHAKESLPKESCGVIVLEDGKEKYIRCKNVSLGNFEFELDMEEYAQIEDTYGEVFKIIHSHINYPCEPSAEDMQSMEQTQIPWGIFHVPTGKYEEFVYEYKPLDLIGREFKFGSTDCYGLIRDYYLITYGIKLINPRREDKFWEGSHTYYLDYYQLAGFTEVKDLQIGDVILMMVGTSKTPNHAAIYIGDGKILHHIQNRLSGEELYAGYWYNSTIGYYRHKDLMKDENS